jgi:hypothetical protein
MLIRILGDVPQAGREELATPASTDAKISKVKINSQELIALLLLQPVSAETFLLGITFNIG